MKTLIYTLLFLVIAFFSNKKIYAQANKEWSTNQGIMRDSQADAHCKSIGMRLPTIEELQTAYKMGITKSWTAGIYWSSTASTIPQIKNGFMALNTQSGGSSAVSSGATRSVICRQEINTEQKIK